MQNYDFSSLNLPASFAAGGRGQRLRDALAEVPGLTMNGAGTGQLEVAGRLARITQERDDDLRLVLEADQIADKSPRELLAATRELPGNLRFAIGKGRLMLSADTRVDGAAHVGETFRRWFGGIHAAARSEPSIKSKQKGQAEALTLARIDAALNRTDLDAESLVRLDGGFELRPKLHDEPTAVQGGIDHNEHGGAELRLHHELVSLDENCPGWNAAAHQALRFNARLRHARLAAEGRRIVAEARLHGGQIEPVWLLPTARAVAAAARHCRTALLILAQQAEVAKRYEEMFLK